MARTPKWRSVSTSQDALDERLVAMRAPGPKKQSWQSAARARYRTKLSCVTEKVSAATGISHARALAFSTIGKRMAVREGQKHLTTGKELLSVLDSCAPPSGTVIMEVSGRQAVKHLTMRCESQDQAGTQYEIAKKVHHCASSSMLPAARVPVRRSE